MYGAVEKAVWAALISGSVVWYRITVTYAPLNSRPTLVKCTARYGSNSGSPVKTGGQTIVDFPIYNWTG
jgi:hypothetical protein